MKNSRSFPVLASSLVLLLVAAIPLRAALPWSSGYAIQGNTPPPFEYGFVYAYPLEIPGFTLIGTSVEGEGLEQRGITSMARFNDSGTQLWSVTMDPGAGSSISEVWPLTDLSQVAGSYSTSDGGVVMGVYDASTLAKVFAYQMDALATDVFPDFRYFGNGIVGVMEKDGSTIRLVFLNNAGTKVIDKTYDAAAFDLGPGFGLPPTTDLGLYTLPSGAGYVLTVSSSVFNFVIEPPSFFYDNTTCVVKLDNSGNVVWAKSLSINGTEGSINGDGWVGPSDQVFLFLEESVSSLESSAQTHVLRFAANGDLSWAKTMSNASIGRPWVEGNNLWSFGSTGTFGDMVALKMDESTGEILAQSILDNMEVDTFVTATLAGDRIVFAMQSTDDPENVDSQDALAISLDQNLQNPIVKKYNSKVSQAVMSYHDSSGSVIFSPFDPVGNRVGVISMNTSLVPVTDCDLFVDASVSIANTGVTSTTLSLVPAVLSVTAAEANTALTSTTMPFQSVTLTKFSICDGGGDDPASPTLNIFEVNGGESYEIRYASETGVIYEVMYSATVDGPFNTVIDVKAGTGSELISSIGSAASGNGFYIVRATSE